MADDFGFGFGDAEAAPAAGNVEDEFGMGFGDAAGFGDEAATVVEKVAVSEVGGQPCDLGDGWLAGQVAG